MPNAQEIREYLEQHGIQNALTTAVNEAIQAQAPNALHCLCPTASANPHTRSAGWGAQGANTLLPKSNGASKRKYAHQ